MELQSALEHRFSCRAYQATLPEKALIEEVLKAGRLSPTARNLQPQRVYVVTEEGNLAKLDECVVSRHEAPCALIIGYDTAEASVHDPERLGGSLFNFGDQDCISVLVHMALKATDLGLGTCWLGAINDLKIKETFGLPETVEVRAVLTLGMPDPEKGVPSKMHASRKDLAETVSWL